MSPSLLKNNGAVLRIALIQAALAGMLIFTGCSRAGGEAVQASQTQPDSADNGTPLASSERPGSPRIPAGTAISVRLLDTISSRSAHAGEEYLAELTAPLVVDGQTLFDKSARARILVMSAGASGGLQDPGFLRIALDSVQEPNGNWVRVETAPLSAKGESHKKRNTAIIGGTSALGAAIGAIAGGGKGAAIGAISGAGAGTAGAYATGKKDVTYEAERVLRFRTSSETDLRP